MTVLARPGMAFGFGAFFICAATNRQRVVVLETCVAHAEGCDDSLAGELIERTPIT